jgi:hypothetical protein
VLGVVGIVVGIALVLVLFVVAIPSLTESGRVEVRLGPDTFNAGAATDRSAEIRERGPILFPDVAGRDRDVYLTHTGDDPTEGWAAFDARRPGTGRECTLSWTGDAFRDPCGGPDVPVDGTGLVQYRVTVTEEGHVVVDFRPDDGEEDGERG